MKAYYLHNIDGRNCALIALKSKAEVRELVRIPASEIAEARQADDAAFALARPGVLFVRPIMTKEPWAEKRRHPRYE